MLDMHSKLHNLAGEEVGTIEIPDRIFGQAWNADLVHQTLLAQEANARLPLAHTKTRTEVRGGGRKPWRQKGTGRARAGSIRSPIWKGGGITFGPRSEKIFVQKVNKKMRRQALFAVLAKKLREGEILFVVDEGLVVAKTKALARSLANFLLARGLISRSLPRLLIVTPAKDRELERVSRNIKQVAVAGADSINVRDLLLARFVLIQQGAVAVIAKTYLRV